jgi:hypothetical protein
MKQVRIEYRIIDGFYNCDVLFGEYGKDFISVGSMNFTKEDWLDVPKAFAHNTVLKHVGPDLSQGDLPFKVTTTE